MSWSPVFPPVTLWLKLSINSALDYYESAGRAWERAAFIKARPCAGDVTAGLKFLKKLQNTDKYKVDGNLSNLNLIINGTIWITGIILLNYKAKHSSGKKKNFKRTNTKTYDN